MVDFDKIPTNYTRGRIKSKCFAGGTKRSQPKGTKWWNNGHIEKMSKNQPDVTFVRGRLKK